MAGPLALTYGISSSNILRFERAEPFRPDPPYGREHGGPAVGELALAGVRGGDPVGEAPGVPDALACLDVRASHGGELRDGVDGPGAEGGGERGGGCGGEGGGGEGLRARAEGERWGRFGCE